MDWKDSCNSLAAPQESGRTGQGLCLQRGTHNREAEVGFLVLGKLLPLFEDGEGS